MFECARIVTHTAEYTEIFSTHYSTRICLKCKQTSYCRKTFKTNRVFLLNFHPTNHISVAIKSQPIWFTLNVTSLTNHHDTAGHPVKNSY